MSDPADEGPAGTILAIDSATTMVVVASRSDGRNGGAITWPAGYRHGETLLPTIDRFLRGQDIDRSKLSGLVVGVGPGAFTGLRVGLATAKGLAHGLGLPLVGISTAEALLSAVSTAGPGEGRAVLLLPAGPADRIVVRAGSAPVLLPAGSEPELMDDEILVAIDLQGRADTEALARGDAARDGLPAALIALGTSRLGAGDVDDLAQLVPAYVTLPRGVAASTGEVSWSHDRR